VLIPLLGCYTLNVCNVADVSAVHVASIFRVKVYKVGEFLCIYRFMFQKTAGDERERGDWCPYKCPGMRTHTHTQKTRSSGQN
jgi:hypothetical protein